MKYGEFEMLTFVRKHPKFAVCSTQKKRTQSKHSSLSPFYLLGFYGSKSSHLIGLSKEGIFSRVVVSHLLGSTPACRQLPSKV